MHRTRFIIWCSQRSGSTHLSSLLDSHPQIACWRELFYRGEAGVASDRFTRSGYTDVDAFLTDFFAFKWGPDGTRLHHHGDYSPTPMAIGFKLKYEQISRYPTIGRYLEAQSSTRIIHLVRENLVSAIVSSKMIPILLSEFGTTNIPVTVALDGLRRAVELDPSTIFDELCDLEEGINRAIKRVAHLPILEVQYEKLIAQPLNMCRTILAFLGVDAWETLSSCYQKIMPQCLHDSISNFDQIREKLRGTRFALFLESGTSWLHESTST
jgi:Sulfotransferase family